MMKINEVPKNIEAEQIVLAGMMNDERSFYEGVGDLKTDYFTSQDNMTIFEIMKSKENIISAEAIAIETEEVRIKQLVKTIDLLHRSHEDFTHSFETLKKVYKKRQLFYSIKKMVNRFYDVDTDELIEEFTNDLTQVTLEDNKDEILDPVEFGDEMLVDMYSRFIDPAGAMGIPYSYETPSGRIKGLPSLDETFFGAKKQDLIMIAGRTGEGKTAFAINLARIFSMHQNYTGYYMNTEMTKEEFYSRLISAIARVDTNEILTGQIEGTPQVIEEKKQRAYQAGEMYKKSKLIPSLLPHLPLYKAEGLAKQTKLIYEGLDYLIVDYVGRMELGTSKNLSTWDELYEITKGLKRLAQQLDIPIIMLAQRNQAGDIEGAKKMANECDGVLYFEPIDEEDAVHIGHNIVQHQRDKVNYKLIKQKVRRNNNAHPIYCIFDKERSEISEPDKL